MTAPQSRSLLYLAPLLALASTLPPHGDAHAVDWRIAPRLEIGEIVTDNARLTRKDPRADMVTRVAPGLDAALRGRRIDADLGYSFVHDAYARDRSLDATRHAIRGAARAEPVAHMVSVDLGAFSSDGPASPAGSPSATDRGLGGDAIGLRGVTVSPNLRARLGQLVGADLRYLAGRVEGFGGGTGRRLADTGIQLASVSLTQVPDFRRLRLRVDGDHAETASQDGAAGGAWLRRSSVNVQPTYALAGGFDLTGAAGFDRIATRELPDGVEAPRWSAGFRYVPSARSSFAVAHGRRFGEPEWNVDVSAAMPTGIGLEVAHRVAAESQALRAAQGLGAVSPDGAQDVAGALPQAGFPARDPYFVPDDRAYVERHLAATLRLPRARDTLSVGVQRIGRDMRFSGGAAQTRRSDVAASAVLGWSRTIGERTRCDMKVSLGSLRSDGARSAISAPPAVSATLAARFGVEHAAGPALRIGVGAAHVHREAPQTGTGSFASHGETVGYLTLRRSF